VTQTRSIAALVLRRPPRESREGESPTASTREYPQPALRPIEGIIVVIDDRELDTLGKLFAISPLRHAMTFEAYVAMRGYARASGGR